MEEEKKGRGGARPNAGRKPGVPNKCEKKPNKKTKVIGIRVSEEELKQITEAVEASGTDISKFLRNAILGTLKKSKKG